MKLVTYTTGKKSRLGAVRDGQIVDIANASNGRLPADMLTFLQQGDSALEAARQALQEARTAIPVADVTLLAPIPNPSKIVAVGLNYLDHVREGTHPPPQSPVLFAKFPTAVIGPGAAIRWDPALTQQVDYEAEFAVVMGRKARRVSAANALDYVAGYTCANDVSARDLQRGDGQWVRAKSLDTFCPLGPWLVTRDEIPDPAGLAISSILNGQVMQNSTTADLIFNVPYLIEFISRAITLLPGDVIATGTPSGVGFARRPPVFLKQGDVITVRIERIGELTNPCIEERNP